jgi:hypothetical protein
MALKALGGDDGITMHRQESRAVRKSRDCGDYPNKAQKYLPYSLFF